MNPGGKSCCGAQDAVQCPVAPVKMNPFPNPDDLTKKDPSNTLVDPSVPFVINGLDWVDPARASRAKDWEWELTGGDCDNILHYPTFALFGTPRVSSGMIGSAASNLGAGGTQRGIRVPAGSKSQVYPAFSLSGDYVLRGKFTVDGAKHECSVKIQVRAPGIRAELCWDNTGNNDLDLHVARLQATTGTCGQHGWEETCDQGTDIGDDVYYRHKDRDWGYANSHSDACHGWGSLNKRQQCGNPRLDRDNINCQPGERNPNDGGTVGPKT